MNIEDLKGLGELVHELQVLKGKFESIEDVETIKKHLKLVNWSVYEESLNRLTSSLYEKIMNTDPELVKYLNQAQDETGLRAIEDFTYIGKQGDITEITLSFEEATFISKSLNLIRDALNNFSQY